MRREWHDLRCFQLGDAGRNGEMGRRGRRRSQGCRFALTDLVGSYSAPKPDAANVGTLRGSWWCPSLGAGETCLIVKALGCSRVGFEREGVSLS